MAKSIKNVKAINTISDKILAKRANEKLREIEGNFCKSNTPWYMNSFNEFCNATALHGYNYIVRKDIANWER